MSIVKQLNRRLCYLPPFFLPTVTLKYKSDMEMRNVRVYMRITRTGISMPIDVFRCCRIEDAKKHRSCFTPQLRDNIVHVSSV